MEMDILAITDKVNAKCKVITYNPLDIVYDLQSK